MSNQLPSRNGDPSQQIGPNLIMHETDLTTIDAQIETGRENGSLAEFLNNFEGKLPGGASRVQFEGEDAILDGPFMTRESDFNRRALSEKTRNPSFTLREFFDDVDNVIATEPEIDPEQLEILRSDWKAATEDSAEKLEVYLDYALPIYRRLRMRGYSHYDLWR
jgi:hypothetical protein